MLKALKGKAMSIFCKDHVPTNKAQSSSSGMDEAQIKGLGLNVYSQGHSQFKQDVDNCFSRAQHSISLQCNIIDVDSNSSSGDEELTGSFDLINVNLVYDWTYKSSEAAKEYTIIHTVNVGSTGKVQLAFHEKSGRHVALKIMKKPKPAYMFYFHREASVQRQLSHPNICRLYDVIDTPQHFVIVQEFLSGGDLFDLVPHNKGCSELKSLIHLEQIISAVKYMHSRGVVHRDIKPENCVCSRDGVLKLIDFGAAASITSKPMPVGTLPYMAPMLFTLLTGRFPWAIALASKSPEYVQYVTNEIFNRYPWNYLSNTSIFILRQTLHPSPTQRVSARDLHRLVKNIIEKFHRFELSDKGVPDVDVSISRVAVSMQMERKLVSDLPIKEHMLRVV